MQYRILECVLVTMLWGVLSGCGATSKWGTEKEPPARPMSLSAVPEPARAVIEKSIAGGRIRKLEKETVDGKVVYDVEATVDEKDVEYDVAADGTVLSAEESIPYTSVPAVVRAAAEKYFGSAAGLEASRELENGKTFYEVEGRKTGHAVAVKLADDGRILEEEK